MKTTTISTEFRIEYKDRSCGHSRCWYTDRTMVGSATEGLSVVRSLNNEHPAIEHRLVRVTREVVTK